MKFCSSKDSYNMSYYFWLIVNPLILRKSYMLPPLFSFTFRNNAHFLFFLFIVIARNLIQLFFWFGSFKSARIKILAAWQVFQDYLLKFELIWTFERMWMFNLNECKCSISSNFSLFYLPLETSRNNRLPMEVITATEGWC